jgi:uncharacterized membrane protein YsdA (DUF1294 family)/cold shock CspA family protein
MRPSLLSGKLIKWKDDRGFGFIQPFDGSIDVFLHISEIKDATRRPQVGDKIYYRTVAKDGKVCAVKASILGARTKLADISNNKSYSKIASQLLFTMIGIVLLSALPLIGAVHFAWRIAIILPPLNLLPLILYIGVSFITFTLYADDKYRSEHGQWRTSEATLHLSELFGGWMGGFIAQRTIRHKSRKSSYQMVFWAIVIIHHIFWLGWLLFNKAIIR